MAIPFKKAAEHLQQVFSLSLDNAVERVQSQYSEFGNRNQRLLDRQIDQANAAQVQLISHFALLATLTLTVVGFLLTQTNQELTDHQKRAVLSILIIEAISIGFGARDYLQTIKFHQKWARVYKRIADETDDKFDSGELQQISDLNEIEAKHLEGAPESTNIWVTRAMVTTCLLGIVGLIVLFYAYFFNVPIVN